MATSSLSVVVVRARYSRERYERQGSPVEPAARTQAQQQRATTRDLLRPKR